MEEAASWCRTGSERSPSGANVPEDFVRQLIDLGALPGEEAGLGIAEVRRSRLLHSWAAAGLSVETILALVDQGSSLSGPVCRFVRGQGGCWDPALGSPRSSPQAQASPGGMYL
jgi:hypothetical protein